MAAKSVRKGVGGNSSGGVRDVDEDGVEGVGAAHIPEIVDDEVGELPKIGGRQLTDKHLLAFNMAHVGGAGVKEIAAAIGKSRWAVYEMKKEPWWQILREMWIDEHQQEFERKFLSKGEAMEKAMDDILGGERSGDNSVNAAVKLIDMRLKIGDKPLIEHRTNVNIDNRTINHKGTINITKVKELMTSDEILDMRMTGIIPDKVRGE